jgi:hypothetical protein
MCEFGQFTTAVCTLETDSLQQSTATIICLPRDRYHVDDSQVANTNIELALSERTQSPVCVSSRSIWRDSARTGDGKIGKRTGKPGELTGSVER